MNKRFTSEDRQMAIKMFKESGLSRRQWCKENAIAISTLTEWLKKEEISDKDKKNPSKNINHNKVGFVEVTCKPEYKASASDITIKMSGSEIIIPADVPIVVMEAIVKVVSQRNVSL